MYASFEITHSLLSAINIQLAMEVLDNIYDIVQYLY